MTAVTPVGTARADRQRTRGRRPGRLWRGALTAATLAGLGSAVALVGWWTSLAVGLGAALVVVVVVALLSRPTADGQGRVDPGSLVGRACEAGALLVAAGGVIAHSVPLALVVVTVLAGTAPGVRRGARELVAVLRWSRQVSHGLRWSGTWRHGDVDRA